jgi:hypothetical protein
MEAASCSEMLLMICTRLHDITFLCSLLLCFLRSWSAGTGPIKDAYNIGENPQFRMEVKPGASGAVWILLTRHITQIDDFRENREYITVLVYKNDGRRVYYPCKYIIHVVTKNML